MENRNSVLVILLIAVVILISWGLTKDYSERGTPLSNTNVCKEDSLQNVINQLQIDIENQEDGWDDKEKRYDQIIFEYELGLEHLKHYHTESYKEFHRIIGYKENYSHEIERENKKRLNLNKW
jgi:hypothetical protein